MVARLFFVVAWKFHVGAVVCLLGCSLWLLVFWMVVRLLLWLAGLMASRWAAVVKV